MTAAEDEAGGLIYGLEFQCRALCAADGGSGTADDTDEDAVAFLVGTQSLKFENQVHALQLDDDTQTINKTVYAHPAGEIWSLTASPSQPELFASRFSPLDVGPSGGCAVEAIVWSRVCADDDDDDGSNGEAVTGLRRLRCVARLDVAEHGKDVSHVSWQPAADGAASSKLVVLVENKLTVHDVAAAGSERKDCSRVSDVGRLEGKGQTRLTTGAWNPHQNCSQYATVSADHAVKGWDLRNLQQPAWAFESPGNQVIRSLDFNPNKQYQLVTAGDDGCLRFWDVRDARRALAVRAEHSHWVWSVRYNQFHDQLLLSSSSDGHVVLSSLASISSEPFVHPIEDDDEAESAAAAASTPVLEDGLIRRFDDHEESVYACEWSCADPWTFASIGYDGCAVINRVPRAVKFKILNLV